LIGYTWFLPIDSINIFRGSFFLLSTIVGREECIYKIVGIDASPHSTHMMGVAAPEWLPAGGQGTEQEPLKIFDFTPPTQQRGANSDPLSEV
jgi:hypothetical protein